MDVEVPIPKLEISLRFDQLEGLAVAIPWGFESPLPHHAYGVMLHGVFRRSAFALRARLSGTSHPFRAQRHWAFFASASEKLTTANGPRALGTTAHACTSKRQLRPWIRTTTSAWFRRRDQTNRIQCVCLTAPYDPT